MVVADRPHPSGPVTPTARARALLAAGALLGVTLAARGVVSREGEATALPPDALASVHGVSVLRSDYARELAAIAGERRDEARDPAIRRHVFERLVDEALIVDYGLTLGLPRSEPRVRAELTSAVIDIVLAGDNPPRAPLDEATLRRWYDAHAAEFTAGGRIHAARLAFRGDDAEARARECLRRWRAGDALDALRVGAVADASPPPDFAVATSVLARYVGASMAESLASAPVRGAVGPLAIDGGFAVGFVLARVDAAPQPFEQVRDLVTRELRRRDDDQRLRAWLDARRSEVSIARASDAP